MSVSERYVEHRWPRVDRATYPTRWVQWFGWRQIVFWTPRVRLRSALVTLRIIPRHGGLLIGLTVYRDEYDHGLVVRAGIGLVEVEVNFMEWETAGE